VARYELKTKPTAVTPAAFINAIENDELRKDCKTIAKLMTKVTGEKPKMWGPTIVGFGKYHYKYASGHEGDMCIAGFAPRKPNVTIYLAPPLKHAALMAKLGKHKMGKSCLYIRRLEDVDMAVLEKLIAESVRMVREKKWP